MKYDKYVLQIMNIYDFKSTKIMKKSPALTLPQKIFLVIVSVNVRITIK